MATAELGRMHTGEGKTMNKQAAGAGIRIEPTFCPTDVAEPFDTTEWDLRTATIKDENGNVLFEQPNCEVPAAWSQLSTNVVVSKYFYGEPGTDERETSVRQLIHRVARTIADWGSEDGYFASAEDGEKFYRDLTWLCVHQHGAFNSPVWFNVGLHHQYGVSGAKCNWRWDPTTQDVVQPENPYEFPQGSACFIQSVDDNMEDIMSLATSEAMLFKFGSGTGTDLSTLRSWREKLAGGGKPSGPLSFMRVYDQIAAVVKSGGKTRRAAKMQSIKDWHPDVMDFIECKWKEEQKAHTLIASGKYEANFNGEAYSSILFQNANLSVRLSDEFMDAIKRDADWTTRWVTDPSKSGPTYKARHVLNRMAECAWHCGDPGVQYDTTINRWHTCPNSGRINASNPCVTGDTLVATQEGLRRIDEIVDQTPVVVSQRGELHKATSVFYTGRKLVYRLRTKLGRELKLTGDHRVWTENRGDVAACDLRKGDVLRLEAARFGSTESDHFHMEEIGRLAGGGWSETRGVRSNKVGVAFDLSAGQLASPGLATQVYSDDELSEYVEYDNTPDSKRLSSHCLTLTCESTAALLRGLFSAGAEIDPHAGTLNSITLPSCSSVLLGQVQNLLFSFGIQSQLKERLKGDRVESAEFYRDDAVELGRKPALYELRISHGFVERFVSEIGFASDSDTAAQVSALRLPFPAKESFTDEFDSLEPLGEEDVYDLTEPVTSHFVANGLVVHNCSEYMFLDNTACNLASINLMKFRQEDGTFDVERFTAACRIFFIAQEILVDHASYPTDDIARNSHLFRPLGLGYSNLGAYLMSNGVAYDSPAGYGICGAITALLHGAANLASAELAAAVGPFEGYALNQEPMLRVMQMHRQKVEEIDDECPTYLQEAARTWWDAVLEHGRKHGFRNAQATVLAPTGTISFMMDCDTTGIEPDIALVKYKQLAGGGMLKIINRTVPMALANLGYAEAEIKNITDYIDANDTIEGAPGLKDEHLPVFDCAFKPAGGVRSIAWQGHVRMMSAAQPFLSGAISKTVNMPSEVTPADIADAYAWGWEMGLKALAIYRDGSKQSQPLNTSSEEKKAEEKESARPRRRRLKDTRQSITHKFNVAGHEGYITVGMFEDGTPGEMFITMAKEGSTVGGTMDCFGTAISMALQYGVPLEVLVNKFSYTRFEPQGHTTNPDIRIAKSVVDYIFRWLGITFLPGFREQSGLPPAASAESGVQSAEWENASPSNKVAHDGEESGERRAESGKAKSEEGAKPSKNGTHHGTNGAAKREGEAPAEPKPANPQSAIRNPQLKIDGNGGTQKQQEQFAGFQTDAPACDNCGSITVRNGNCYLCYSCGNSMGCS